MIMKKPKSQKALLRNPYPKSPSNQIRKARLFMHFLSPLGITTQIARSRKLSTCRHRESPLATITEWLEIWFNLETGKSVSRNQTKPDGDNWVSATRETNTMPQWAGSCWYHLRYLDPQNENQLVDPTKESYWGSPDFYIGGGGACSAPSSLCPFLAPLPFR